MMLCCLLLTAMTALAQENAVVFCETFDTNSGTGGRDDKYEGSGVASSNIKYDNTGWAGTYVYGGKQCLRFGNLSNTGTCTTPAITPGSRHALLTFSAAGWGDTNKNTLTITANTGTLTGDTSIELVNQEWNDYTVLIDLGSPSSSVQLTFTGKRGFLDDVVVRSLNTVPAPTLPDAFTFWPNTTENSAARSVTLQHEGYTTVRYTTDGTEPTTTMGTVATQNTSVSIKGTTTVKAIAYVGELTSSVVTRTYTQGTTVSGISAFKALAEGTEARLYMAATDNARVTMATGQAAYLRDNTGVLCLDFGATAVFNPQAASQQHVAGWLIGKYQTVNGRPTLVATENTNTNYLALAAPVTEASILPVKTNAADINSHVGDWVEIAEMPFGTVSATNDFGQTTALPYDGSVADVVGVVTATNQLAPTSPVTFVIDETKPFVSPAEDLEHANVRLKRTLSQDYWNTFAVPFDIASMGGSIREYDHADGQTMVFKSATGIEAGKPYLVKPASTIANPSYDDVTLRSTAAQTITDGDYSYVATYSPYTMATDQTELFLTTAGALGYPTSTSAPLKGMRAYIRTTAGAPASMLLDEATAIQSLDNGQRTMDGAVYNLNGQRVTTPTKGLYIINGKKVIIK